jgi:hypothetical protein
MASVSVEELLLADLENCTGGVLRNAMLSRPQRERASPQPGIQSQAESRLTTRDVLVDSKNRPI